MHRQAPTNTTSDIGKPDAESPKFQNSSVPLRAPCNESDRLPEPWIPESKLRPFPPGDIKSNLRNILLTTPEFPRFYADVVLASAPNSHEAKILRPHYQNILNRINHMTNSKACTHIKVTGVRCGSPALTGEQFCYFHQRMHRGVRTPPQARLHPIALIEDEESIQSALMEVINALMRNTIDLKRATLILRALHIAVKNASRVKFHVHSSEMVKQIPEYPAPTEANVEPATTAPMWGQPPSAVPAAQPPPPRPTSTSPP